MTTTNFILDKQITLSSNQKRIEGISPIRNYDDSKITVCIRQGLDLSGFEYQSGSGNWIKRWSESVFKGAGNYQPSKYPWLVSDKKIDNKDVVMIQHPDGVRLYEPNPLKSKLELLAEDGNFHDVYGWNNPDHVLLFGNFYSNLNEMGVLTRNDRREVAFYAVTEESFLKDNISDPLLLLDKDLSLSSDWSAASTEFFLTNLHHKKPSVIGLRTIKGLQFYQFDSNYLLNNIVNTSQIKKPTQNDLKFDKLFFGDLTHQIYQDILHFNGNSLHVYQYSTHKRDYKLLHKHTGFSQSNGWLPEYSDSIKLADINYDGRDDLIYTGPNGITVLTFDTASSDWKMLLNPADLSENERYVTIVGSLPAIPSIINEPSVFMQDTDGEIKWAKFKKVSTPITTTTTTTTLAPKPTTTATAPKISATATILAPETYTQSSTKSPWERDDDDFHMNYFTTTKTTPLPTKSTWRNDCLIPKQINRKTLDEKPFLRWAEQWEENFFKDIVDTASGQVRFKLPLIDISTTTAWNFQIDIFYHSQATNSELLGEGWSIPLAQDYIQADHRGSIYPEDVIFYLVSQENRKLLKLISNENGKQRYELVKSQDELPLNIEYYPKDDHWIVQGAEEQIIYGKANRREAKDALQWSLEWPNWRGPGQDIDQLQSLVTTWYINARVSHKSQHVLYYDYEQDKAKIGDKYYTAAIRLKTIRDNQQFRLDLDYSARLIDEYIAPKPIDNKGNVAFPVPLAHSHYLKGYSLTTADYRQNLQFIYQIENKKRLLIAIQQPMFPDNEIVLKCSYQRFLEKPLLKSLSFPTGATVNLNYETVTPSSSGTATKTMLKYPIKEIPKIAHGSDYSIMSYRDNGNRSGKIIFYILNRELTKIINDCSVDAKLSCPSAQSKIDDYKIQTYQDNFVVLIESKQKKSLHFFERREQMWTSLSTNYNFGKTSLTVFSEKLIAVADTSDNKLKIFERVHNPSTWTKTETIALTKPITRLAIHNSLIVYYNDYELSLIYRDSNSKWKNKTLVINLGGFENVLNRFELDSEIRKYLLQALNKNGLQIFNNIIALNSLEEQNGQLSSRIHLMLLDKQYQITKKQDVYKTQENIHDITYEQEYENSNYHLKYVEKDGRFKIEIYKLSGKVIKDIEKIGNKNKKEDSLNERIKQLNDSEGWKDFFRKNILIKKMKYFMQINQQDVYLGEDVIMKYTGTLWQNYSRPKLQQSLGKHFILEPLEEKKRIKLYAQDGNDNKIGQPIEEFFLHSPDSLVNRYPVYIAFQHKADLIRVLTFKDEKTIGEWHTVHDEQLLLESDWQNLITAAKANTMAHIESHECRVRPLFTLATPHKPQLFVNQMVLTDGEVQRITGYQHVLNRNEAALTYTEKAIVIPGANKKISGWYEATRFYQASGGNITITEKWFDSDGKSVIAPPKRKSTPQPDNQSNSLASTNPAQLFDREKKWLISDFYPYNLADEMVGYYGFEPYEENLIGSSTLKKIWRLVRTELIEKGFSFTGQNYLKFSKNAYLEGEFTPRDQNMIYLASCWLRSNTPLKLNSETPHFKAMLSTTNGQKIIGLQGQVKRQLGNWSYIELPIDFSIVRQIYKDYYKFKTAGSAKSGLPSPKDVRFKIILKVAANQQDVLDLDHVRFSPLALNFQARIYNPLTGQITGILQSNGLVTKTIFNRLQKEVAGLKEDGELESFSSSSKSGKLAPSPFMTIDNNKPVTLTFEPEQGFYESFDAYALCTHWKIDDPAAWNIAPGQLWHQKSLKNRIQADPNLFFKQGSAIRFYFGLQTFQASLSLNWKGIGALEITRSSDGFTDLKLPNGHVIKPLQSAGELIVMLEKNYIWVWIDGVLLFDLALSVLTISPWSSFYLEAKGHVLVEDLIVMNHPQLRIEYHNAFGDKTQVIQLKDANTIQVTETIYDELGRDAITSKSTRITRSTGESLLKYRSHFVSNKNPSSSNSVLKTGNLQGEVDKLNHIDQGFAYTRTEYNKNPLNEKSALGLAGSEFSITGSYATKYSQNSNIPLLDNLFPTHQGYRQVVQHKSNGSKIVTVFDHQGNQVANYVKVPSFNHLLTTYEYDNESRLIKILSPLYHQKVNTEEKTFSWQANKTRLSFEESKWQKAFATNFFYDNNGNLIRKITPDTGTTEYLYNSAGQKRFMVSITADNQTKTIVYFNYDVNGQLIQTGYIKKPISIDILRKYLENSFLPNAEKYQKIDFADENFDPESRGRIKRFITNNDENPVVEELQFNDQQQIISKSVISTIGPNDADKLTEFSKQYTGSKLQILTYPIKINGKSLKLLHRTNRLGQLLELGTSDDPTRFARFTYDVNSKLESESYQIGTRYQFTRNYRYNSPGFLEKISDPFLSEEITYTKNGYGQAGFGDGMVMQTVFNASWPDNADGRWFKLKENDLDGYYSEHCIQALKRAGYLTTSNKSTKLYLEDAETSLPLVCNKKLIAKKIAEKQVSRHYGHRYAYGNHQELVKAKYFTNENASLIDPLQPNSFSKEISGITPKQSQQIWKLLTDAGYIVSDQQQYDIASAVGKPGISISIFRDAELLSDLKTLDYTYTVYLGSIKQLVMKAISQEKWLSLTEFVENFLHWISPSNLLKQQQKELANKIGNMLIAKGYLPTQSSQIQHVVNKNFSSILSSYSTYIPKIVKLLSIRLPHKLGSIPFDTESYDIDANGNHRLFYNGLNRYELTYNQNNNQINSIKLGWDSVLEPAKVYEMQHDNQGNVIKALHCGIETIEYHPVSQRTTLIKLNDGRSVRFYYDAQGERVLKRVLNSIGEISHETYYLRDEKGHVLVDQRIDYASSKPIQKLVTAYLYGPRGLIGFVRNENFYSVMTDHAGSIRLVIRNGQVVAAYDYMPYGELMRSFGNDPESQIMYRYSGHEWDAETGLYNFHARLYDPKIGRFYQPDPKSQYFSPYKYAGNSPVSLIDPDGEEAILISMMIIGFAAGLYLGGAAANNRWNPADWDFKDSSTYLGMAGGAIAGALLPVGFAASVGTIGLGGTILAGSLGSYLTTAAANGNWDPSKWRWDRPHTYYALLQGFSSGTGVVGGVGVAHNFAGKFSFFGKTLFLTVSYSSAGAIAYAHGVMSNNNNFAFWEWDFSNPATWAALVDGFDVGMGWPQTILQLGRGIGKLVKDPRRFGSLLGKEASKRQKLIAILKNPKHPFYKVTSSLIMAYFMGSTANDNLDITRWNLASFSTYEGVLNGIFFGRDTSNMLNFARQSRIKKTANPKDSRIKIRKNNWLGDFSYLLDNIQFFRKKREYTRLLADCFSTDTWRSKLKNEPAYLRQNVETFLKQGFEQWKKGNTKPPKEFQKLLFQEAEINVQGSSKKLKEWQQESDHLSKKRTNIFPDEDASFLSCSRRAARRKRSSRMNSKNPIVTVPSKQEYLITHNKMYQDGYVLIGYHGTNGEAATSILSSEFLPTKLRDIYVPDYYPYVINPFHIEPDNLNTIFHENPFNGIYVADDIRLSLGYAVDIENHEPRVLAVYAKKDDIIKIDLTSEDIHKHFNFYGSQHEHNFDILERGSIFGGMESGFNLNEIIIKEGIDVRATVFPVELPKSFSYGGDAVVDNVINGIKENFMDTPEIKLENVLEKTIRDIESERGTIYTCSKRGKRSIEPENENYVPLDFINNHTSYDSDTIDFEFSDKSYNIATSSASKLHSNFWPIILARNVRNNLASIGNVLWQRLSPQYAWENSENQTYYQGLQIAENYTIHHLQGGLQLADLLIRKITRNSFPKSTKDANILGEAEAKLQASLLQWGESLTQDNLAANPYSGYKNISQT